MPLSDVRVHVVDHPLPGARVATLGLVGRDLYLVADRRKPDAGEHAAILLRQEAPALVARVLRAEGAAALVARRVPRQERRWAVTPPAAAFASLGAAVAAATVAAWDVLALASDLLLGSLAA